MTKPIYKVFLAHPTEAGYQLPDEERNELWAKHNEAVEKYGVKSTLICDSSWASEQFLFWGVEEFPNIEAVQEFHKILNDIDWFRYFEAVTLLGTQMEN
jgi:hypothetical protein